MSSSAPRSRGSLLVRLLAPLALGAAPLAAAPAGNVFLTVDEALELAFPGCEVERRTVWLTEEQRARAEDLAGEELDSGIVRPYVAYAREEGREGTDGEGRSEPVGTAYFDTHRVRTLRETLMVVVDPEGRVRRLEVLAFAEPEEYLPRGAWYAQFLGRELDDELHLGRGIRAVTGATLTARATTSAVRRILAAHAVLEEVPEPQPEPEPQPQPAPGRQPAPRPERALLPERPPERAPAPAARRT